MTAQPWPVEIRVRPGGRAVWVSFDDRAAFELSAALLRAMTPSAAERGHGGPSFEPSATASRAVAIRALTPVGRYAVKIGFDDGHDTGLYSWERLHRIGRERETLELAMARGARR